MSSRWPLTVASIALAAVVGGATSVEAAAPAGQWWSTSYRYRQKLTVKAGATAIPTQYSVRLQFNHSALVALVQSLASGNDVRVAWCNGSGWVELDRRIDDQSTWNNAATRIWFRTQAHVGLRRRQPVEDLRQAHLERIDVPGGEFHEQG